MKIDKIKNENGGILSTILLLFLFIIIIAIIFAGEPSNSNIINNQNYSTETPQLTEAVPSPITVHSFKYNIDSAGGVEWNFSITNNTEKTINYIYLKWNCYNAVGDFVYDEITLQNYCAFKYTGPLLAHANTGTIRNFTKFYNHTYNNAKLVEIQIVYEDGTTEILENKNLPYYQNLTSN